ncbi:conserved hypothetical protein [Anaeromyxobacter dehalogenans 2CP-1]|uniref:Uncharacterized protein n=1 Tax=Anaeromyxobacter dehalogenans (strain ATCC BAA-258 / DSM 21875 / 2CP-1) TaxID=455488 RepID=B8JGP4_ANAD2|nr:conserved hypothetical protein [Anaeromyxobacter dehalogenans 2CP-1]
MRGAGVIAGWGGGAAGLRRLLDGLGDAVRSLRPVRIGAGRPPPARAPRLPRSRLGVALEARLAVRSGVRLEDFLRYRLARYAARLPVPLEALPVSVDVDGGEPVVRARPQASTALGPTPSGRGGEPRWVRTLVQREGAGALREIRDAEAALDALAERSAAARDRIEAAARALAEDLARGAITAPVEIEATAEQLGRPPVPPPFPVMALRGAALALLLAETWRLARPVLGAAGLSVDDLPGALQRAPLAAGLSLAFAAGAAGAVLALLGVAVRRGLEVADGAAAARRGFLLAVGAAGAAALAAAVAASGAAPGRWTEAVLLLAVPLAAVACLREASRRAAERDAAEAAALEWDRERTRDMVERGRRAGVVAEAEAALARVEAEREEVRRRLRALERRAVEVDEADERAARAEARRLERLSEALAGALELDRYAYLRRATAGARGAAERPAARPILLERAAERLEVAG